MRSRPKRQQKRTDSSLSLEQRRLQEQQRELKRREEELNRRLAKLPVEFEERRRRERDMQTINSFTLAREDWAGRDQIQSGREKRKRHRPLRSEQRAARVKFLVLCLILAAIVVLLLRVIP